MKDQEQDRPKSYSCCGSASNDGSQPVTSEKQAQEVDIRRKIREQYATIASSESKPEMKNKQGQSIEDISNSGNETSYTDYSKEDLSNIPQDANLNLGSGNPVKLADLREGEIVVDLGSGA